MMIHMTAEVKNDDWYLFPEYFTNLALDYDMDRHTAVHVAPGSIANMGRFHMIASVPDDILRAGHLENAVFRGERTAEGERSALETIVAKAAVVYVLQELVREYPLAVFTIPPEAHHRNASPLVPFR